MSNRFPNSQFGLGVKDESRFKPKPRPRFLKGHSSSQPLPDSRDPPAGYGSAPASSWSYSSGNDTLTPLLPESFGGPSYPIQDLPLCNQRSAIPNMDDILFGRRKMRTLFRDAQWAAVSERDQESPVLQSVRDNVEPERHENISDGEVIAVFNSGILHSEKNINGSTMVDDIAKGKRGTPVHIERSNEVVSEPNFHQSNELKRRKNGEPTSGSPNPGTQERGSGKRIRLETSLLHRGGFTSDLSGFRLCGTATQSPVKCLFEKHCSNSVQVEGIAECGLGDFVRITKRLPALLSKTQVFPQRLDIGTVPLVVMLELLASCMPPPSLSGGFAIVRCLFQRAARVHEFIFTLRAIVKKINAEKPSMLPFFAPDALAGILRDETYDHTSL
ncbi:hypothetical protein K438DRAFT_1763825 [Mycena galopus ATCC 62051]|nr:hypothetical protein K438DRAFT_1763825 [Mycena galopus ATCC 62051]